MGWLGNLKRRIFRAQENALDDLAMALGRVEARQLLDRDLESMSQAEFKVFSQRGEDGIIQYLIQKVPIANPVFVEFGVGDYRESNTRFLACSNRWGGLIMDGGCAHVDYVDRQSHLGSYARVRAKQAFITRESINPLLQAQGLEGDIGLLSVDLDGMDYWVLDAITQVKPRILVAEYNAFWGADKALTLPYQADFQLGMYAYFGASLRAVALAAGKMGMALVGCETGGVNAFFVRRDLLGPLKELEVAAAFRPRRIGDSLDAQGKFGPGVDPWEVHAMMARLPLVDVENGVEKTVGDWFGC